MGLDHDKILKTKLGARGAGWKPVVGSNNIHILPPHSRFLGRLEELDNLAIQFRAHYFKFEGRPTEVTRCLGDKRERCPACEVSRLHRESPDPALVQMSKDIRGSDQYLFNIIDRANIQLGIQYWNSNYTCWNKIMAIAGNPMWGDIVAPEDNVWFVVTLTPGTQSRSGRNAYEAMPQPERQNITGWLAAIENWQQILDGLADQITAYRTFEEIRTLIRDLGFPELEVKAQAAIAAPAPMVSSPPTPAPPPPTLVAPPPIIQAPSMPESIMATTTPPPSVPAAPTPPSAPAPVPPSAPAAMPAPPSSAPPAATTVAGWTGTTPTASIHYDPGPDYTPKMPDGQRPPNVPRCFSDYQPTVHRCAPCPVIAACQMKMLGVD